MPRAQPASVGWSKGRRKIPRGIRHEHGRTVRRDGNRTHRGHQPPRLLSRHEFAGTADVLGLRGGLGARRHGFHDLSARDRHHHCDVESRSRQRRACRDGDVAGLGGRRLAGRLSRGPDRPRQNLAAHHPVVLVLLAGLRLCAEFRSVDRRPRIARSRLRRRMGRRRRADGRSDPPAISRPRGRLGAIGLGSRLGACGVVAGDPVLLAAA